ncbi:MAG TPA: protein kinase [Bryobacteraceae bacterium]|nr:protein kinase [Bryobacteraceae bacterium]
MESIGRYQITRELGRGAMGVVYLAVDPTIGRNVAIKTIRLGEVTDQEERAKLRERLFREARSAGILSHPGIVTIYDMEEHDDVAFIAMEFVDGPTLDQLLSKREPLAPERLMSILRQTAAALDYAHAKGIVHRDIKPANIMIASDGAVKITDFGIAKVTTSQQYTQTGTILGTPNYMSPEQVQGLAVTGRADQFSLAVIAFEMLAGDRPFTGEHLTTVVYKIVAEDPPPVQRLNPTLGPQIDNALRRGLAKKPEARYSSCIEFINGLDSACASTQGWKNLPRGGNLSLPTVIETPARTTRFSPGSTTEEVIARRSSRWRWVLPFAAALVVALGLIGLIALQFGTDLGTTKSAAPVPPTQTASTPPPAETPASPTVEEKKPTPTEQAPAAKSPDESDQKPQETSPAEEEKKPAEAEQTPAEQVTPPAPPERPKAKPRPAKGPQDVFITSEPPGATAVLDGNPSVSCKTPCILSVLPGHHSVSINQPGYQQERREITIIDSPVDFPRVTLRSLAGTLYISSDPPGASITLNGQSTSKVTPSQFNLPPGTYNVRLEKNGLQKSISVEIRNGETTFQKIPLL